MKYLNITGSAAAATFFVLAGCSSEPSSDEITAAVQANFDRSRAQAAAILGATAAQSMSPTVHKVEKISCTLIKDSSNFRCQVNMDMEVPMLGRTQNPMQVTLLKTENGWQVIQ